MFDNEPEKIRLKKVDMILKLQSIPTAIIEIHTYEEITNLSKDYPKKIIIIDFWADWCGPCKVFKPIFEKLQKEYYQDFIFTKVNVDENREMALDYRVNSIPTTLFLKSGKIINKIVGTLSYKTFKALLEKLKG